MNLRFTSYREAVDHLPEGASLVAQDVSWDAYEQLLEELDGRPRVRVTYDNGRLEIMSPLPEHEEYKRFIEKLIDATGDYLDLNIEARGSATWKNKKASRGTEPDTCYYVANAERIIGKRHIDLAVDPPPDLAVEIDATNESLSQFAIYATLHIPEVWRYAVKESRLHMYALRGERYIEISSSKSLPILGAGALEPFIEQSRTQGQKAAMAAFRRWLKKQ